MSKKNGILVLDAAVLLFTAATAFLSWQYLEGIPRIILLGLCGGIFLALLLAEGFSLAAAGGKRRRSRVPEASALLLLNEAEQEIRRWNLRGRTSMLLGKGQDGELPPEIDLGDTEYCTSIDSQHAVLNYSLSGWLVEDLSSRNGTVLLKPGEDARKLVEGVPCLIGPGDRLYVAGDTVLAVK